MILVHNTIIFMAQGKLKTFKGVFLKESVNTRTMILLMKKQAYSSFPNFREEI